VESLLVIANHQAGTTDRESLSAALTVLRRGGPVELTRTARPAELERVLVGAGTRRIVVAGGDGSLHAVLAALHRRGELRDAVLGLLPLGTGNDFARGLDIPLDVEAAARVVLTGETRRMDLVVDDEGSVVVNSVHVGAGAEASQRAARLKERFGRIGYPMGAALTALKPRSLRLRVEVDGELVGNPRDPLLMVAVGNGSSVGGGTELTPEATPRDGRVDVLVSRATGPWERIRYAASLGLGRHHRDEEVTYVRGTSVSVSGEEFWCSADGEIYGPERLRTWRVEKAAYSMVLPG
jgi:YegS/Rv2252/BmrU family lipid kinase